MEYDITTQQQEFRTEAAVTDWGVLISEWQGHAQICILALSKEQVIAHLEAALEAVKKESAWAW